jgi:hypothetical protein
MSRARSRAHLYIRQREARLEFLVEKAINAARPRQPEVDGPITKGDNDDNGETR